MTFEHIVIILLILIFIILIALFFKSSKKSYLQEPQDFEKIEKQLNSLLYKTIEQSGYVNSKIDEIGDLTKKMTNAMTSNISDMGQMGEVILENILQDCGMTKNRDYQSQYTDQDEDGQTFRPDIVVFLPEKRNLIIDSKVPMRDWYDFQNAKNNENKEGQMKNFILAIRNHINVLSKKNYSKLLNINSPNYIFMFMPHEFAIVHAQKYDSSILQYAQQKQIIIVGPSTLVMCMKLVESIWKIENQNKNSKEIAKIAGSMIDQIAKTINLMNETSKNLDKSMKNIEDTKKFIKDGNQSLYNKANKMRELGAENKIKIDSK
ncbi:RmuC family DNA recombination protein [alpha proteobacterium HIMB59]|nr:RmuC family DNA recombination protein [alpha proteobacterium HIMB59]